MAATAFKILAIGPNPAYQRVLTFDSPVQIGGVNRASAVASCGRIRHDRTKGYLEREAALRGHRF